MIIFNNFFFIIQDNRNKTESMMNLREELTCKDCKEIYQSPITLNCCGENICKKDVEKLISKDSSSKFTCPLCSEENFHQKLNPNKFMQKMVENKLHKFKTDRKSKRTLKDFKIKVEILERLATDPKNYIHEEIDGIKRQVELDRETSKGRIDSLADGLIQELESYESRFKAEYKPAMYLNSFVKSSRKQLAEYEKFLNLFSAKKEKKAEQRKQSKNAINMIQSNIDHVKTKLFSNLSIKYQPIQNNSACCLGELVVKVSQNFKFEL